MLPKARASATVSWPCRAHTAAPAPDRRLAEDPVDGWRIVRGELDSYGAGLDDKRELIALTKSDLLDEKKRAKVVKALEKASGARVFAISAPLEEGLEPLLDAVIERLATEADEEGASNRKPGALVSVMIPKR